jgi:hypothetical protein
MQAGRLERFGVGYLRRRHEGGSAGATRTAPPRAGAVLTAEQQRALLAIERGAIVRGALAGALCGGVSSAGEVVARAWLGLAPEVPEQRAAFWGLVGAFVAVGSILEVAYLYLSGLRAVHRIARTAGVDLFPSGPVEERHAVAGALARAALELPNPRTPLFGIDPMRETSKLRLVLGTIAYKAKIGVTNLVLKALLRRVLVRVLMRAWLPLVSIPVVAGWNAIIVWRVLREARIRAIGASAARELVDVALGGRTTFPEATRLAIFRAVGATVVRKRDLHPNTVVLLVELASRLGEPGDAAADDARAFLACLPDLPAADRSVVLDVLAAAVIMDGRVSRAEVRLLEQAHAACGRTADVAHVRAMAHAFVAGRHLAAPRTRSPEGALA